MQLLRLLLPLMAFLLRDRLGWPTPAIGALAILLFSSAWLAGPLRRLLGTRSLLLSAVGTMALARIVVQATPSSVDPLVDLVAAAVGFVAFAVLPVPLLALGSRHGSSDGASTPVDGIALGAFVDLLLLTASTGFWDWAWRDGALALVVGLVPAIGATLVGSAIARARLPDAADPFAAPTPIGWSTIGAFLVIYLTVVGNPGRLAVAMDSGPHIGGLHFGGSSGGSFPPEFGGLALGLAIAAGVLFAGRTRRRMALHLVAIAVVLLFQGLRAGTSEWGVLAAAVACGWLLAKALRAETLVDGAADRLRGLTQGHGAAFLIGGILLFVDASRLDLALVDGWVLASIVGVWLTVGALPGARPDRLEPDRPEPWIEPHRGHPAVILAVLVGFVWMWILPGTPRPDRSAVDGSSTVTVMTYNLHCGIDPRGALALEHQAQTIEEADPDVVLLQEVPRGWILTGSTDVAAWLAERLEMTVTFAPTGDPLWGDAILSRLPVERVERRPLPSDGLAIQRGVLEVEVVAPDEAPLVLLSTHLHHPRDGGAVRRTQVEALVDQWDHRPRTVLGGDFNARPEWPELDPLRASGLVDAAAEAARAAGRRPADTFLSTDPEKRIDYLWSSPDLRVVEAATLDSTASDHRAVVATFELSPLDDPPNAPSTR